MGILSQTINGGDLRTLPPLSRRERNHGKEVKRTENQSRKLVTDGPSHTPNSLEMKKSNGVNRGQERARGGGRAEQESSTGRRESNLAYSGTQEKFHIKESQQRLS